jgi:ADP-ribosyl-[dinitrogen reductase] hydrolase
VFIAADPDGNGVSMKLTSAQSHRAAGVMLAMACGDALGAPYEFAEPPAEKPPIQMKGGGALGWEPGEWTDDTAMAIPILRAAADGQDLRDESVLDDIAAQWIDWARSAQGVGRQVRAVLSTAGPTAAGVRRAAREYQDRHGRSAGNGSLMRTAPVALAYLRNPFGLAEAARTISDLTHFDPEAGDACVLWSMAIQYAVLTGELEARVGLDALPAARRGLWATRIDEAERRTPADFGNNGWVVEALQGAWASLKTVRVMMDVRHSEADLLRQSLENAVRGGGDCDTVAAITGALAGARYGVSAVPADWRRRVHGWPGLRGADLVRLSVLAARGGRSDEHNWPSGERVDYSSYGDISTLVQHPHDKGVWLGGVGALDALPAGVDAVVSLCRVGTAQVPERIRDHLEVWLVDDPSPEKNPNLDFVLYDTADAIAALRAYGRTVLVHGVSGRSRMPTVAALYSARHLGVPMDEVLKDLQRVLPSASPNAAFLDALRPHGTWGAY